MLVLHMREFSRLKFVFFHLCQPLHLVASLKVIDDVLVGGWNVVALFRCKFEDVLLCRGTSRSYSTSSAILAPSAHLEPTSRNHPSRREITRLDGPRLQFPYSSFTIRISCASNAGMSNCLLPARNEH
mmetsp:Transcript_17344/g.36014  ORF Transcript_17344/g.36014 Transcript_17344/m.36014 type:complete len:128 (+) Transcript_17344:1110-1493(+)